MMSDQTSVQPGSTGFEIDRSEHLIRFVRDFGAPPARVFEAWTIPEQVALWWDAMGERLATCEIDLRPGGKFSFITSHHPDKPFSGTYREIAPPDRLVFEANGAVGRVTFTPAAEGTRMTVEIVCASDQHLEQFVQFGIAAGTSRTLDNLVRYMEGARTPAPTGS